MIEEKIRSIVADAEKSLEHMREITIQEAAGVISQAMAQVEALVALGKQVPDSLAGILGMCNGGKSFMVHDFEVCAGIRGVDVELRGAGGGWRKSFYSSEGEMLPGPKGPDQNHKVRVVVMVMPVKEPSVDGERRTDADGVRI